MSRQNKHPDRVTREYIEAYRLGVFIRTPLENVVFFQAEHKAVLAHTKTNGSFVLNIPLWKIELLLAGLATLVERSHVVMHHALAQAKRGRWVRSCQWQVEIITSVTYNGRVGLIPHLIPVSRRLTQQFNAIWTVHHAQA